MAAFVPDAAAAGDALHSDPRHRSAPVLGRGRLDRQPGLGVLIQMNSRRAVVSDLSLARWRDDHLDAATPDRLQYFAGGGAVSNDYIDGIHPSQRHH